MNIQQEFHLKQMYHEITFRAYDIEKIEKITPYNLSRIYVPECIDRANNRNYYIRDMNGKTHVQALCCEKPTEENVKKAIDRFIKGKEEGRTYS